MTTHPPIERMPARERAALDAPFRSYLDPNTHHWPGCAARHADCRCYWPEPALDEFAVNLRDGDRAILAMALDTSTTEPLPPIEAYGPVMAVRVTVLETVEIAPGWTVTRESVRIRSTRTFSNHTTTKEQQ
jgi:hypothetical protein